MTANASPTLLEAAGATKRFGGLTAVSDFSLSLRAGELVGLIGPNGAGKTTVFNLLTGVYPLTEGDIRVCGKSTRGMRPDRITSLGLARTFQNIRLFNDLEVIDNVKVACDFRAHYGLLNAVLRLGRFAMEEGKIELKARKLLRIFDLEPRAHEVARSLPYGDQRRLEIVRALATEPKVLLLDEPAAGMNPKERHELGECIRKIKKDFDLTILLIEHDMKFVMSLCERIVVLDHGAIIAHGTPAEVQNDPKVIEAYLGEQHAPPAPATTPGAANA